MDHACHAMDDVTAQPPSRLPRLKRRRRSSEEEETLLNARATRSRTEPNRIGSRKKQRNVVSMKRAAAISLLVLGLAPWLVRGAPPTCYSRVLGLSKSITSLVERLQRHNRTRGCMDMLPRIYLDVHNSCVTHKLRDFIFMLENFPTQYCRERHGITFLKRKVLKLYTIISRMCYRDLVYFTDDCDALESGRSVPRYGEDRLELLQES
ncbi:cytokine-like protein 1 [Scleropages formosus]|uniref:Cytokine like 1 n=1 Tax=Scleropages formosus TaxID=113540 RepID=A0A8C9R4C6_SCLFO|nr:cytokine-like protein 1 [Scleropages formosus]